MTGRLGVRFRGALSAGGITLLLGILCTATLAAPELSTVQDFGHTHPHGTPHHLHPLALVFSGTLPVVPVTLVVPQQLTSRLLRPYLTLYLAAETLTSRSRAPPQNV